MSTPNESTLKEVLGTKVASDVAERFRDLCERSGTNASSRLRQLVRVDLMVDQLLESGWNRGEIDLFLSGEFESVDKRREFNERRRAASSSV